MGKHRSRLKILATILSVISDNDGAKKTQIMYQAYLSYKLLVNYLNDVLASELVVCKGDDCYRLTPKGEMFLAKFSKYSTVSKDVSEQMNQVKNQRLMLEEMCPNSEVASVAQRSSDKR